MTTLDQLAIKHKADKSSLYHAFTKPYDSFLAEFRNTFTSVMEIGVGQGQSIRMWCDFFPNAEIHAVDIEPSCKSCESYSSRIKFHQVDQAKENQLKTLKSFGPYDLIVDDGNHFWLEQIVSFDSLFPFVSSGGFYVVEDSCTSYWREYGNYGMTCVQYFMRLVDEVNLHGARGKMPVNPSPDFGNWEQGWHRRPDCHDNVPDFESIQFFNGLIVIRKRGA